MAKFSRLETLTVMLEIGLIPVFHHSDSETARKIVQACADGGARIIEFTNRGDLAWRVFCDLIEYVDNKRPEVILGAGSVIDAQTASLYINSGANFIVGPSLNPEAARVCNRRKIPYLPGCGTVTEISRAEELGAEIVKIFPGGLLGGPAFVQAVLGPMPWTRIMPTGGVAPTKESIEAWIKAGAACLGMGSNLIRRDWIKRNDWTALTQSVANGVDFVRKARQDSTTLDEKQTQA